MRRPSSSPLVPRLPHVGTLWGAEDGTCAASTCRRKPAMLRCFGLRPTQVSSRSPLLDSSLLVALFSSQVSFSLGITPPQLHCDIRTACLQIAHRAYRPNAVASPYFPHSFTLVAKHHKGIFTPNMYPLNHPLTRKRHTSMLHVAFLPLSVSMKSTKSTRRPPRRSEICNRTARFSAVALVSPACQTHS